LNLVREARLRLHMSQDELAEKSNLARPTVSKIERGQTIASGLSKQKIAEALDCPIPDIFPDEGSHMINIGPSQVSNVMGIAVVNGSMAAAGVRGAASDVAVREAKIEGFLINHTGDKCPNAVIHLIQDGEKVDSTVSGRQGRFVFKDLEEGDYTLLAEEKFQHVKVSLSDETFEFEV